MARRVAQRHALRRCFSTNPAWAIPVTWSATPQTVARSFTRNRQPRWRMHSYRAYFVDTHVDTFLTV
jgi:hypothetical protein